MGKYGVLVLVGLLLGLCSMAFGLEDLLVIYDGKAALPADVTLGDWGFLPRQGDVAKALQPTSFGPRRYGLKLASTGRYQGARFDFAKPVDSAAFFGVKSTYLEIYLRAAEGDKGPAKAAGGTPTDPAAGPAQTMQPEQPIQPPVQPDPAAGAPPMAGGDPGVRNDGGQPELPAEFRLDPKERPRTVLLPTLKNLRFTFYTDKGVGLLTVTPEQFHPRDEVNQFWVRVDIPLHRLHEALPVGGNLTRMVITSDAPAEYVVGRIAMVRDSTPLQVKTTVYPAFLEAGRRLFLAAKVEPGLARYETVWDFDTKAGASIDATGDRVTYTYDAEGNYIITCTVRDLDGGKEPVSSMMEVKVSRTRD